MAPSTKVNLKNKIDDGVLDLSMSGLQEVPVKEIGQEKKVWKLDLSNNQLTTLGKNFSSLTQITHLDLSNNNLRELPENFGNLKQLKHLDLYSNQLKHLPLSFAQLKSLKWLDLKNNPLVPALAQVAGPCIQPKECQQSAKKIVEFLSKMQNKVDDEIKGREAQKKPEPKPVKEDPKKKNKKEKPVEKPKTNNKAKVVEKVQPKAKKAKPAKKGQKRSFLSNLLRKFITLVLVFVLVTPLMCFVHEKYLKERSEVKLLKEQVEKVVNVTIGYLPPDAVVYKDIAVAKLTPVANVVYTHSVMGVEKVLDIPNTEQYKVVKAQVQSLVLSGVDKVKQLYNDNVVSKQA